MWHLNVRLYIVFLLIFNFYIRTNNILWDSLRKLIYYTWLCVFFCSPILGDSGFLGTQAENILFWKQTIEWEKGEELPIPLSEEQRSCVTYPGLEDSVLSLFLRVPENKMETSLPLQNVHFRDSQNFRSERISEVGLSSPSFRRSNFP